MADIEEDLADARRRCDDAEIGRLMHEQGQILAAIRDATLPTGAPKPLTNRRDGPQETLAQYVRRAIRQIKAAMPRFGALLEGGRIQMGRGENRYLIPAGGAAPAVRFESSTGT